MSMNRTVLSLGIALATTSAAQIALADTDAFSGFASDIYTKQTAITQYAHGIYQSWGTNQISYVGGSQYSDAQSSFHSAGNQYAYINLFGVELFPFQVSGSGTLRRQLVVGSNPLIFNTTREAKSSIKLFGSTVSSYSSSTGAAASKSHSVPLITIPAGSTVIYGITLQGYVRGALNFSTHAEATAPTAYPSSGLWTETIKGKAAIGVNVFGYGSATVLTLGVYGRLDLVNGSMTQSSSITRTAEHVGYGIALSDITARNDAPATLSLLSGELGVTYFGVDSSLVSWNAPISVTTNLYAPKTFSRSDFIGFI